MTETKCTVRDGRFVEACGGLLGITDNTAPGFSRKKGVARWSYTNLRTREPSRTFFGVISADHPKGLLFNFCPVCGAKIDAPFAEDEPAQVSE